MGISITAIFFSVGAVVLAEMGDKTQLLAMAFATKYKASKVLLGVFIATVFNHALAVAVGNYVTRFEGAQVWINAVASLAFIFFGFWTLRGDKLEGEENRSTKFGPIVTVAIGFFIAEMGDKTQLATIALATRFPDSPLGILIGTTTGMLIADAIGIIVGIVLCKKIPEKKVKIVSACAFMLFGFIGCYQVMSGEMNLHMGITVTIMVVIIAISAFISRLLIKNASFSEDAMPSSNSDCSSKAKDDTSDEN